MKTLKEQLQKNVKMFNDNISETLLNDCIKVVEEKMEARSKLGHSTLELINYDKRISEQSWYILNEHLIEHFRKEGFEISTTKLGYTEISWKDKNV